MPSAHLVANHYRAAARSARMNAAELEDAAESCTDPMRAIEARILADQWRAAHHGYARILMRYEGEAFDPFDRMEAA